MKRSAPSPTKSGPKAKKPRPEVPEYHSTPSMRDETGDIIWPAPSAQIEGARNFIKEWYVVLQDSFGHAFLTILFFGSAAAGKKTLIIPDKDADGLTSGAILQKTLVLLGLDPSLICAHLLQKGSNIHIENERSIMASYKPEYIFVLDQGSRKSAPVIDGPHKALVIDHHFALDDDFPQGSEHVSACTHGDLGNTLKWEPPFPDMKATFKAYTKKAINDAVSLINAPRRTSTYDVPGAWQALISVESPRELLKNPTLLSARAEVNAEVERCAHTAPKFSADGRIAVFRINSAAQIHPVIATRWAGHLQSPKLEVILVANEGYLPDLVNFSCRVPRSARAREPPVNIIEVLKAIADNATDPTLRDRLGESFARGHKEASGGIVPRKEFEELIEVLEIGKKAEGSSPVKAKAKNAAPKQANTLMNYFGKPASK
ncbi:hypothetical protein PG988_013336 [Apiospora saccharicola]